jgi:hypothetical protein
MSSSEQKNRLFHLRVLGRTLEHLGVQMYKRRDIAIAELVANSWDAGATSVNVLVPNENDYEVETSEICIIDNGIGMSDDDVENQYLVVGRNRRLADPENKINRPIMGRKGIGKLAGFGLANNIEIITWRDNVSTQLTLDIKDLKTDAGETKLLEIPGVIIPNPKDLPSDAGTIITLRNLKHKSPPDIAALRESLSRRFSRRVRGEMHISINGEKIKEPELDIDQRFPEKGMNSATLQDGGKVRYYYAFTKSNIRSKELQGFTVYVKGKTAQAPPFFFHVETTASGLHWARYMTGEIEADYIDDGSDDESDLISTDRQEIDWADEGSFALKKWGDELTRKALREWAEIKGERMESAIMQLPEITDRVEKMDKSSQTQVSRFLKQLGQAETDNERAFHLADSLVRAYEYRHFHDMIDQIEDVGDNPEQLALLLEHLREWKVLESRAILEVIKGRLEVIEKFHSMIVNNAPETASSLNADNMHDLLAGYPWILNPEWQVLAEEKKISKQLKEWSASDIKDQDERMRYDFLALSDEQKLVVIEIKRSGHSVELDELHRLEMYKERLSKGSGKEISMVMICGGTVNLTSSTKAAWDKRPDGEIRLWSDIYDKTRSYYEHYQAILDGDINNDNFSRKEKEVAKTRAILQPGASHRPQIERKKGLGPQDRNEK